MDVLQVARVLVDRRRLRARERWTREQLLAHQARALAELRRFAAQRSPFYTRLHRGLERAPLSELPVVTKAMVMGQFDEVATDPALRLAALEQHLSTLQGDERFAGRYWVSATSGSSGLRTIVPSDAREWSMIIASYGRANEWGGLRISPFRPVKMAIVSSRSAFHQSGRVGRTIATPLLQANRLDANQPLPEIVVALNAQQPKILVAYNSMLRILAEEQLQRRLHIAPAIINGSSEVLTPEARALASSAWGRQPFEVYAATETGGIAAECERHRGLHLFEDLLIPEVVDDQYRPVPAGQSGARLLVTVLFSRSLPLIRYELTDRVRLATAPCECGLPFQLVAAVEGRTDDVLQLPGPDGTPISVHPVLFHGVMDQLPVSAWQVRQEPQGLRLLIAGTSPVDPGKVVSAIKAQLERVGVSLPLTLEVVNELPASASGKRPMVVALRR